MDKPEIVVYSNHLTVEPKGSACEAVLMALSKELISYDTVKNPFSGEVTQKADKVFCDRTNNPVIFRYHIEMKARVLNRLHDAGIDYEEHERETYIPVGTEFPLNDKFKPFDYQEPIIEFINSDGYKKIITMATGSGKTATFLFAMVKEQVRTALVIPPKYIERWLSDTQVGFNGNENPMIPLNNKELMVIQGTKQLRSLIMLAASDELQAKFIIISAQTLFSFIKNFRETGRTPEFNNIHPSELWELLGIGMVCVDEGHENFHANFRLELYTHTLKTVTLSATLQSDDSFLESMHQILYPKIYRRDGGVMSKHAGILYVPYMVDDTEHMLKTSWRGRSDYSQLAYEADILKPHNAERFANLLDMLIYDIEELFINQRVDKYKLLIFFDSVEMVVKVSEYLADRYTDFKVGKYTAEESIEVLDELEMIVATTKSADTGIDIKDLQMVQCFVARGSSKANIQMFGRIRKPKNPKANPVFLFYYALNIPQHGRYTQARREIFKDRSLYQQERLTHFKL